MGGQDKGLQLHQGLSLFEHVLARLGPQVADLRVSANRNLARYARSGFPVLADGQAAGSGPLTGIATLLAACPLPWLLTVPVDAPLLPADLCVRLLRTAEDQHASIVVADDGQRAQPLFALYRSTLAEAAALAIADGERAVWRFQEAKAATRADFSDQPGAFLNLNHASDLLPGS